ncbi:hypothetical protein [Marinilactibacillus piezotolerans]|uniref:hypothetical protein n=1 Tax=Marinilactibacillus piezotolerans TaxID=258723 RepID=UPI0009B18506|nr:hypothetical protein [Marinilactibacillus piezotolerans]
MRNIRIEIMRFLKQNIKTILLGALLLGIIFSLGSILLDRGNPESEIENDSELIEGDGRPAFFNFYVENPDGSIYTNTSIIEQYLLMDETLEDVSQATNTNLYELFQKELEIEYQRTPEDRGVLGVTMNPYSYRISLVANTGNEQDNLNIVQYFYEQMQNQEIDFLTTKDVYYFEEPAIQELDENIELDENSASDAASLNIVDILIRFVIGSVLGVLLVTGITVLMSLFSKKLKYSFTYSWDEKDVFFLNDPKLNNNDELVQFINFPKGNNKLVVSNEPLESRIKSSLSTQNEEGQTLVTSSVTEAHSLEEISEIILIVNSNKTDRKWYKKQRRSLEMIPLPTKVVQINAK